MKTKMASLSPSLMRSAIRSPWRSRRALVATVVPILILVFIGIYSFRLLFLQYEYPKPDLTIKAIGNAWYWEHVYQDHDGTSVVSNMLNDGDILRRKLGDDAFELLYGDKLCLIAVMGIINYR